MPNLVLLAACGEPEPSVAAPPPDTHTFTFTNSCLETVWVGSYGQNGSAAIGGGGWALTPGQSMRMDVPVGNSGRIWPRTGCSFGSDGSCPDGINCCKTGGCLTADGKTFGLGCAQTGVPPATLLEWTLDAASGNGAIDYYDSSMVDGWSVPVRMTAVAGTHNPDPDPDPGMDPAHWCAADGCTSGKPACPTAYRVEGSPDSCWSPCMAATNAGSPDATKLCCTCSLTEPVTCPDPACAGGYGCTPYHDPAYPADMVCDPWNADRARAWDATAISYIDAVKKACPNVYSWQFDDAKATFNCRKTDGLVDYSVEFCPVVAPASG